MFSSRWLGQCVPSTVFIGCKPKFLKRSQRDKPIGVAGLALRVISATVYLTLFITDTKHVCKCINQSFMHLHIGTCRYTCTHMHTRAHACTHMHTHTPCCVSVDCSPPVFVFRNWTDVSGFGEAPVPQILEVQTKQTLSPTYPPPFLLEFVSALRGGNEAGLF